MVNVKDNLYVSFITKSFKLDGELNNGEELERARESSIDFLTLFVGVVSVLLNLY